jgi:hypothetical protein
MGRGQVEGKGVTAGGGDGGEDIRGRGGPGTMMDEEDIRGEGVEGKVVRTDGTETARVLTAEVGGKGGVEGQLGALATTIALEGRIRRAIRGVDMGMKGATPGGAGGRRTTEATQGVALEERVEEATQTGVETMIALPEGLDISLHSRGTLAEGTVGEAVSTIGTTFRGTEGTHEVEGSKTFLF